MEYQVYDINSNLVAEYTDTTPASTTNISYTFQDSQGSTRATTDKVGVIQSRTDYQAFGEEISAGTGQRTSSQGFNASLGINQKYGQTERDEATGLDHTWFRKHENKAGRWTSPDPYNASASIGDPQSFNRYSYAQNEPTNFTDPSGLNMEGGGGFCFGYDVWREDYKDGKFIRSTYLGFAATHCMSYGGSAGGGSRGPDIDTGGGGGGGVHEAMHSQQKKKKCQQADPEPGGANSSYGADKQDILDKLAVAGVAGIISNINLSREGITFTINNRAEFLAILKNNDNFRHNTPFGAEHAGDVGANLFTVRDFRSFTSGGNTLRADSTGFTRSLQIDVGPGINNGPNNPQTARGYADLDCDNPAQDIFSFFKHAFHVIGSKLKN